MIKLLTPKEFIASMPAFLRGQQRLTAVFSTYNSIQNYSSGKVNTSSRPGLTVEIACGELPADEIAAMYNAAVEMRSTSAMTQTAVVHEIAAKKAQETAESLSSLSASEDNMVLVAYAGISAFQSSLDFVKRCREKLPKLHIVILTCNCNLAEKSRVLEPLVANSTINEVILSRGCGGYGDMSDFVTALIRNWNPPQTN